MQQRSDTPDAVSTYFRQQGITPEAQYFGNSRVMTGWRVKLTGFELVYRLEEEQLVVCDFRASEQGSGKRAAAGFIKLIHQLERAVPRITLVRGLLLDSIRSDTVNLRERLADALIYQGARWQEIDGAPWLVYRPGGNAAA